MTIALVATDPKEFLHLFNNKIGVPLLLLRLVAFIYLLSVIGCKVFSKETKVCAEGLQDGSLQVTRALLMAIVFIPPISFCIHLIVILS